MTKSTTRPSLGPLRLALPVALVVVVLDQLTKRWALSALDAGSCAKPEACIDLLWGLRFHLVFNTGAAFTRGEGYGPVLGIVAFAMAGFLFYLSTRRTDRLGVALFGAIAGGAIGNLLDRIFRAEDGPLSGAVVDFVDAQWWPVFNVADAAIVLGILGVVIHSLFEHADGTGGESNVAGLAAGGGSGSDGESGSGGESGSDGGSGNDGESGAPLEIDSPVGDRSE